MAKKLNISDMAPKIVITPADRNDKRFIRCKILIVCEGEKTEPNYFKSFDMMDNKTGIVYEITNEGGGINTIQVVEMAIKLRDAAVKEGKPYDSVWAVFDRDSFKPQNFDNAINKAESQKINVAWSNEAFELWYIFHFCSRTTAMKRSEYKKQITNFVKKAGYKRGNTPYVYKKNDVEMRKILSFCHCSETDAISRARQQHQTFTGRNFNAHNPCTTVYKLVNLLIGKDAKFNDKIKEKIQTK